MLCLCEALSSISALSCVPISGGAAACCWLSTLASNLWPSLSRSIARDSLLELTLVMPNLERTLLSCPRDGGAETASMLDSPSSWPNSIARSGSSCTNVSTSWSIVCSPVPNRCFCSRMPCRFDLVFDFLAATRLSPSTLPKVKSCRDCWLILPDSIPLLFSSRTATRGPTLVPSLSLRFSSIPMPDSIARHNLVSENSESSPCLSSASANCLNSS